MAKNNTIKIVAIVGAVAVAAGVGYYLYTHRATANRAPASYLNQWKNSYAVSGRPTGNIIYEESRGPLYYLAPQ